MRRTGDVFRDDSGATALVVAIITAFALMAMAAVVIDAGMLYAERRSVQTAADSAALAGVRELPKSPSSATVVADSYVAKNPGGTEATDREYTVASTYMANDTLKVHITAPSFGLLLSKFLGTSSAQVGAQATAVLTSPTSYSKGVMPIGIVPKDSSDPMYGFAFNDTVNLKEAPGTAVIGPGDYGWIRPDGYKKPQDAINDGGASATIGETISTKPGESTPATKAFSKYLGGPQNQSDFIELQPDGTVRIIDYSSPHLIVCPIISQPSKGGEVDVKILELVYFWVDSFDDKSKTIVGHFLRPLTPEEADEWGAAHPFGAVSFRLTD